MNFERGKDPIKSMDLGLKPIKLKDFDIEVVIRNQRGQETKYDMKLRRTKYDIKVLRLFQNSEIHYSEFFKLLTPNERSNDNNPKYTIIDAIENFSAVAEEKVITLGYDNNIRYQTQSNDDFREIKVRLKIVTEDDISSEKAKKLKAVSYKGSVIPILLGPFKLVK